MLTLLIAEKPAGSTIASDFTVAVSWFVIATEKEFSAFGVAGLGVEVTTTLGATAETGPTPRPLKTKVTAATRAAERRPLSERRDLYAR
jgi:hypothetical protein